MCRLPIFVTIVALIKPFLCPPPKFVCLFVCFLVIVPVTRSWWQLDSSDPSRSRTVLVSQGASESPDSGFIGWDKTDFPWCCLHNFHHWPVTGLPECHPPYPDKPSNRMKSYMWRQTMSNESKFLGNCQINHTAIQLQSLSASPPLVKAELSRVDLHNPAATATALQR